MAMGTVAQARTRYMSTLEVPQTAFIADHLDTVTAVQARQKNINTAAEMVSASTVALMGRVTAVQVRIRFTRSEA
jgi:hypothetical protein